MFSQTFQGDADSTNVPDVWNIAETKKYKYMIYVCYLTYTG